MNVAAAVAAREGGLEEYDGLCMELVNDVLVAGHEADVLWIELDGHPEWKYHAVPVIDGVVHDAWHPDVMLPPAEYVAAVFGRYQHTWELNPGA